MKDTIDRSGEVLDNLEIAQGDRRYAYAFAFGFAWAMLSEKNRKELLKISERKAQEKDND